MVSYCYGMFYIKRYAIMADKDPPSPVQEGLPLRSGDCGSSPQ